MINIQYKWLNIARQALHPLRFAVMLEKLGRRVFHPSTGGNIEWLMEHEQSIEAFMRGIDESICREAMRVAARIERDAQEKLATIPFEAGGGGCYPLLYFLIRTLRPSVVVETGVAAGLSSYASLWALQENGLGHLYSSDFPYFRLANPERYIGCVVPEELRDRWTLYIDGDRFNLPKIVSQVTRIDLLHYDSDKSYAGREIAMESLSCRFSERTTVVMDDIQDDSFFYDYVTKCGVTDWKIFKFNGKFLGVIGLGVLLGRSSC